MSEKLYTPEELIKGLENVIRENPVTLSGKNIQIIVLTIKMLEEKCGK